MTVLEIRHIEMWVVGGMRGAPWVAVPLGTVRQILEVAPVRHAWLQSTVIR